VKAAITFVGFMTLLSAIINLIFVQLDKYEKRSQKVTWKVFRYPILMAVIIFVAWIPCYLAYYSGIFSYDITIQTLEAMGISEITRFHPPLHTYFWKFCVSLENGIGINGLVFYSIVQMLLMAGAFAYLLRFLVKRGCSNGMVLGALLYFA